MVEGEMNPEEKLRKCLKCQKEFESKSPSNRICQDCKLKNERNSFKNVGCRVKGKVFKL